MIQDIFPHILNNQFDATAVAADDDTILNICEGKILVYKSKFDEGVLIFPKVGDFAGGEFTYLFAIDDKRYFLLQNHVEEKLLPYGFEYVSERSLRSENMGPDEEIFAAITGKHLSDWYRDNAFCGRCGRRMAHSDKERAMKCPECGYTSYPRIMPAVIVGVINNDRILITKYRTGFAYNALIAGFTEIGETVEETVKREVLEEAGIKVKNIRYYKSQPWGSANDILLGFYCDLDGDETITMDNCELKYARWLRPEEIELQPGSFSLTNEMMKLFKEGKVQEFYNGNYHQ